MEDAFAYTMQPPRINEPEKAFLLLKSNNA